MSVLILQTSDGVRYKKLLDITAPINSAYAEQHGYAYKRWDGIKVAPTEQRFWATFNRIYLLLEELDAGTHDWILYMDADALVYDGAKPVTEFITNDKAVVACRGGDRHSNTWDINTGVVFYNMRHPRIRIILEAWLELFLTEYEQGSSSTDGDWDFHVGNLPAEYPFIQRILMSDASLCKVYRGEQHNAFNYDGPFIKHVLRNKKDSIDVRADKLSTLCLKIRENINKCASVGCSWTKVDGARYCCEMCNKIAGMHGRACSSKQKQSA